MADGVRVRLLAEQLAVRLELGDDPLPRLRRGQPDVVAGLLVHGAVEAHHRDRRQIVSLADLEVGRIVRRGDLDRARTEAGIDRVVGDDNAAPIDVRDQNVLAHQVGVAFVLRVYRDADVAENRLRSRGRHADPLTGRLTVLVDDRVTHVGQLAFDLFVFDFEIRDDRRAVAAPVGDPVAAIDQPLVVQPHEGRAHRLNVVRVHREQIAGPVGGCAELPQLELDVMTVGLHPFPHLFEEAFAAKLLARESPLAQVALHHQLAGDAGVVAARHPQAGVAEHAMPADHQVLEGHEDDVPVVQPTRDVRGRHDDHERRALPEVRVRLGPEDAVCQPVVVPAAFGGVWVVRCVRLGLALRGRWPGRGGGHDRWTGLPRRGAASSTHAGRSERGSKHNRRSRTRKPDSRLAM